MMRRQRGAALLTVIFFVVIMALLAGVTAYLVTGDAASTIDYQTSEQALNIAQGGLEQAIYQYKTGTACASLTNTNVALGNGTYTTSGTAQSVSTTLSSGITATDTVIPVASLVGLGTHGLVSIQSEALLYTGTSSTAASCTPYSAPCLTGARRAQNLTTAAAHAAAQVVVQSQCTIRSVGTARNAQRTVEAAMLPAKAAFYDGPAVTIGTTTTTLGTLNTTLPAGKNIILARMSFRNYNATHTQIGAGNMRLLRSGTLLAQNQFLIDVGGIGTTPSGTVFPQETQYLLYSDNAPANASYSVTAFGDNSNTQGEVNIVVLNGQSADFLDGGAASIGTTTTTLLTFNASLPAGNNYVLAVVQIDNTAGGTRSILAGNLRLSKGGTLLSTNQFDLNFARQSRVNEGTAMLLLAQDIGAAANPTYTVTGLASGNGANGEVKIAVLNGVKGAFINSGAVALSNLLVTMATLNTTFPAGENAVIASTQYQNTSGSPQSIALGNERLVYGGVTQVSNQFQIDLCSAPNECNDFDKGLLWRQATGTPSPSYSIQVQAGGTMSGSTKVMAVHIDNPIADWQEIFP